MSVLVIPDCHCPGLRSGFVDFLKRVADKWAVNKVIHIGDLVDWASISYHEKNPSLSSAKEEYKRALRQVQTLHKAFPKAEILLGNHDVLTERQCTSAGLPTHLLKSFNEMWEIDWVCHPRYTKLIHNSVIYSHGEAGKGGQDAAIKQAKDNFRSTVIGHFHSQAGVQWWANPEFRVFGLSVGCGIDFSKMQFEYGQKFPAKPILGCGVVTSDKVGHFEPWLLKSR